MLDVDYFSAHHALIEDQKSSPFEINLGWTVSHDKGPYNGRRALRDEKARGSAWAVRRHRGRAGTSLEALYAERGLPPRAADRRVARERADLRERPTGRLRDERLLVAAAQEVPRARAPAGAALRRRAPTSRSR